MKCRKRILALAMSLVCGGANLATGEDSGGDAALRAEVAALRATIAASEARRPDPALARRLTEHLLARVDETLGVAELAVGANAPPSDFSSKADTSGVASFGRFAAARDRARRSTALTFTAVDGAAAAASPAAATVLDSGAARRSEANENEAVDWNRWEPFAGNTGRLMIAVAPQPQAPINADSPMPDAFASILSTPKTLRLNVLLAVDAAVRPAVERRTPRLASRKPAAVAPPPLAQGPSGFDGDLP